MNVSMISNSGFKNNYSFNNDPLEKVKQNIQKEIEKEKQSKDSKEVKASKIKALEDNLKQINEQQMKQKAEQSESGKNDETQKNDESLEESSKTEEQKKADANVNITKGFISVSSHLKTGKVSFNVYKAAELRGDAVTAERASKYTTSELTQAKKDLKLVQKGLKEYKKQLENRDKELSNNKQTNKTSDNNKDVKNDNAVKDTTANTSDTSNNNDVQASQSKPVVSDDVSIKTENTNTTNTIKIDAKA